MTSKTSEQQPMTPVVTPPTLQQPKMLNITIPNYITMSNVDGINLMFDRTDQLKKDAVEIKIYTPCSMPNHCADALSPPPPLQQQSSESAVVLTPQTEAAAAAVPPKKARAPRKPRQPRKKVEAIPPVENEVVSGTKRKNKDNDIGNTSSGSSDNEKQDAMPNVTTSEVAVPTTKAAPPQPTKKPRQSKAKKVVQKQVYRPKTPEEMQEEASSCGSSSDENEEDGDSTKNNNFIQSLYLNTV